MLFSTHILFGIFLATLSLATLNIQHPYWFFIAVLFGSIFVDIDEHHSFIGRKVKPLSWILNKTVGHRGIFHSLLMASLIALVWYYFVSIIVAFGFLLGYVGHLLADGITKGGVKIFYPFSDFTIKGFIKTGGILEIGFFVFLLVVTVVILL